MANKILRKKADFENLYQTGSFIRFSGIRFCYLKNKRNEFRYAFRISKKKVRKAVHRNKLRRWGKFILGQNKSLQKKSIDLIIEIHQLWDNFSDFKPLFEKGLKKIESRKL